MVIVLAFLVLLSVILLAFFTQTSNELTFSSTAANSATAQALANTAVNVVMAQIDDGTAGQDSSGNTLAWASQPGMIRTYDNTGTASNFYKLYSSSQMVVPGSSFSLSADVPQNTWTNTANAGLYTDLNAPILVSDPNGLIVPSGGSGKYSAVYPIVDPYVDSLDGSPSATPVDGFSMSSRPGYSGGPSLPASSWDPTQPLSGSTANPAPMPASWLYVLHDGTIVSPTGSANGSVTVPGASSANPVTGRIAFWTDDDTSKVNINTASEGTYWNLPRLSSAEDFGSYSGNNVNVPGLAICQPAQQEFQRYPGHPATTSLSPIFGQLGLPVSYPTSGQTASQLSQYVSQLKEYYDIAPRIIDGGSNGGTSQPTKSLAPDKDRLYASVDELMFSPLLTGAGTQARVPNTANGSTTPNLLKKNTLEKTGFFLTANSNAPEVTLFNTPRLSIWPVWAAGVHTRTPYDNLAAFCGTIPSATTSTSPNYYYFTRSNARSSTDDYTGRNTDLYGYLQNLTAKAVPGFGGNFLSKFGADRDQILTLIYDYIRCINISDNGSSTSVPYTPKFDATNVQGDSPNLFPLGAGEVVPIQIGTTQGAGRIYTISEADLLFYASSSTTVARGATPLTTGIKAVLVLGFTCPMEGVAGIRSSLEYTVAGLETLRIQPTGATPENLNLPSGGMNYIEISDLQVNDGRGLGGTEGPEQAFWAYDGHSGKNIKKLTVSGGAMAGNYPFFSSAEVSIPLSASPSASTTNGTMAFLGGNVTIKLNTQDTGALIQTFKLFFPPSMTSFGVPTMTNPTSTTASATSGTTSATHDFNTRLAAFLPYIQWGGTSGLITAGDTVVGLQIAGSAGNAEDKLSDNTAGDTRMIAPLGTVTSKYFRPELNYSSGGRPNGSGPGHWAHGLQDSLGKGSDLVFGSKVGVLVNGVTYLVNGQQNGQANPIIPSRVSNGVTRQDGKPGDWDTGVGTQPDGSYMNKPDDGDAKFDYAAGGKRIPYNFGFGTGEVPPGGTYFSPERQVPSAMMFGSIPTGVQRMQPWQSLLFNPHPEDANTSFPHPGLASPPDHLLADLFWMPVVEPYAISQPFSTAGKINLNYQIVPFTYINRKTGMYAALKSTKILAIPPSAGPTYKLYITANGSSQLNTPEIPLTRKPVDVGATLTVCDSKFANGDIYKSATEISGINLVPMGQSASTMASFWQANSLTGNNVRDEPYVDVYPRLTTKSNTFTVHYRVQSLKKTPATAAGVFADPSGSATRKDVVLAEYRGSTTIERYIDLNPSTQAKMPLPDFAKEPTKNIGPYYRFRVVGTRRFSP